MSELERLRERLAQMGARNFHFTPGPDATPEAVAREVNKALDALERGELEPVEHFED